MAEALLEKRNQLINAHLYDVARKADAEAEKIRNFVKRFEKTTVKQRLGLVGRLDAVQMILDQYDLRRISGRQIDRNKVRNDLFEAIKASLGSYVHTADFSTFLKVPNRSVRDDLAAMFLSRARLVLASEMERGEVLSTATVKAVSGGDSVRSRELYARGFDARATFTTWLQANSEPRVDHEDRAMWGRIVAIPFGPTLRDDERDPSIKEALLDPERGGPAILSWLIQGAIETAGCRAIAACASISDRTSSYREEQDPLREWLIHSLRLASPAVPENWRETYVTAKGLAKDYARWCDDNGMHPRARMSMHKIGARLRAFGCAGNQRKSIYSKVRACWLGVTILDRDELAEEHWSGARIPSEAEHHQVLGITDLPNYHASANPRTCEEKNTPTRAREGSISFSHACGMSEEEEKGKTVIGPPLDDDAPPF
jgi:P4 family phage/plasmid primase-like protien